MLWRSALSATLRFRCQVECSNTRSTTAKPTKRGKEAKSDRASALLTAAGYNFGLLLRWPAMLLHALFPEILRSSPISRSASVSALRDS